MDENVAVQSPTFTRADAIRTGGRGETKPAPRVPLGEELPLFCEKCGYSLHGMPAVRCDHCTILQFHCPECGHHQPINTLRPAAHRILGRLRATALGLSVLFKLAFFGLLLFAWAAMPGEWIYRYNNNPPQTFTSGQITINGGTLLVRNGTSTLSLSAGGWIPRPTDPEAIIAHALFGVAFGVLARLLLLRWRRAWAIGAVLGVLVAAAYALGAWFTYWEHTHSGNPAASPLNGDTFSLVLISVLTVMLGALLAWPIWSGLAQLFLPKRTSTALLQWQQSLSDPSSLARQ